MQGHGTPQRDHPPPIPSPCPITITPGPHPAPVINQGMAAEKENTCRHVSQIHAGMFRNYMLACTRNTCRHVSEIHAGMFCPANAGGGNAVPLRYTQGRGLFRDHLYILRFRLPKRPFFRYKEGMANPNNLAIERDVL